MADTQNIYLYENRKPIRLTEVFQSFSTSGVALISEEAVLGFNPSFSDLSGCPKPATIPELPRALQNTIRKFLEVPSAAVTEQIEIAHDSDFKKIIHVEIFQLADTANSPVTVVLLNDIGSVQALESHIRRLDRLANIGTLAASAAHEIKNCLVTIKTFLDTVLEDSSDEEMAQLVKSEMGRINNTTSQLLKFSGSPKSEMISCDVHDLIQHSLRLVQHQFAEKRIDLIENFQLGQSEIEADGNLLEQAFINLFLNAFDAVETAGKIRVTTRLSEQGDTGNDISVAAIHVTVEDNGEGIAEENIPHLFRRFFTTKENGTGLGLAITQQIVKEHRGKISVQSEVGKGTKFQITLPLK